MKYLIIILLFVSCKKYFIESAVKPEADSIVAFLSANPPDDTILYRGSSTGGIYWCELDSNMLILYCMAGKDTAFSFLKGDSHPDTIIKSKP